MPWRIANGHVAGQRNSALKTHRGASVVISGHAFIQNLRRGHYELGGEARTCRLRVAASFDELAAVI